MANALEWRTQFKNISPLFSQSGNNSKVHQFYIYNMKVILNSWEDNKVHGFIFKHMTFYMIQWQVDKKNGGQQLSRWEVHQLKSQTSLEVHYLQFRIQIWGGSTLEYTRKGWVNMSNVHSYQWYSFALSTRVFFSSSANISLANFQECIIISIAWLYIFFL